MRPRNERADLLAHDEGWVRCHFVVEDEGHYEECEQRATCELPEAERHRFELWRAEHPRSVTALRPGPRVYLCDSHEANVLMNRPRRYRRIDLVECPGGRYIHETALANGYCSWCATTTPERRRERRIDALREFLGGVGVLIGVILFPLALALALAAALLSWMLPTWPHALVAAGIAIVVLARRNHRRHKEDA
jgi:hypothetical protein